MELLRRVAAGALTPDAAAEALRQMPFEVLDGAGDAVVDHHRTLRTGVPEVVLGEWKTAEQIAAILRSLGRAGDGALATRVAPDKAEAVLALLPEAEYLETPRLVRVAATRPRRTAGSVAVVCAGTSDLPVVEEAVLTAQLMGNRVETITDVGVAGVHRLLAVRERLAAAEVVVVVAGMEGALASAVAGLVSRPVIAVPTSVGYGASFGGLAALLAMMSSCAAGVTVVNIDNGFGAAYAAALINRREGE